MDVVRPSRYLSLFGKYMVILKFRRRERWRETEADTKRDRETGRERERERKKTLVSSFTINTRDIEEKICPLDAEDEWNYKLECGLSYFNWQSHLFLLDGLLLPSSF